MTVLTAGCEPGSWSSGYVEDVRRSIVDNSGVHLMLTSSFNAQAGCAMCATLGLTNTWGVSSALTFGSV